MEEDTNVRWSRQTRTLVVAMMVGGLIWFLYVVRALIGPLVVAALLAYVLDPVVTFFNRRTKLPRSVAVTGLYIIFLALLVGLSVAFTPVVIRQSEELTAELDTALEQFQLTIGQRLDVFGLGPVVDQMFSDVRTAPTDFVESDRVLELINSATTNILWVLVIFVVTFYLLLDWGRLRDWLIRLAPPDYQGDMRRLYGRIRDIWQQYLRGTLVLMVVIGLMTGISLALVGMPGAAALGVLTGVLDAILSIGPAVAMIIAAIVAWLQGSTYLPVNNVWFVIVVVGIYLVIQGLENVYLRPRIMGRRLQMHPAIVFLAIIGALSLVGPIGALIVLPVIATVGVIIGYLRRRILGLDPWAPGDALAQPALGREIEEKDSEGTKNGD